jgi:hypothetical protein
MARQGRKRDDCRGGDICEPEKVEVTLKNAALSDSDSPVIDEKRPISHKYEQLHRILHRLPAYGAYRGLLTALSDVNRSD